LNQAETATLAEQFDRYGVQVVPFGEDADWCIINTCTVTQKTDYRCRQIIRRVKKIFPNARIAVVGCYAQLNPDKISEIGGVDFILGSDRKFELVKLINSGPALKPPVVLQSDNQDFQNPAAGNFWDHTRAFLKIQDGCDSGCAYCTVPLARGRSRSDSLDHIVKVCRELTQKGHKEIVLTGVHIGAYGKDLVPPLQLLDVVKRVHEIEGVERVRLSSLEPLEVDDSLIDWIADSAKVCHHFHIPLQSGADAVLKRMNRNYSAHLFEKIINKLRQKMPGCGLGADIIVGFPGETERHFQQTVSLVERLPLTYAHVFSYSARPLTAAAGFEGQVSAAETRERSAVLRAIAQHKKKNFYRSLVNTVVRVLWEEQIAAGWLAGWTDQYVRVKAKISTDKLNQITRAKIISATDKIACAEMVAD